MPKESFKSTVAGKLFSAELAGLRRAATVDSDVGLLDFVVKINPKYQRPEHLGEAIPHLERVLDGGVRLLLSAPPRFSKTETIAHLIAMYIARDPSRKVAFISYAADLSESKSLLIREYVIRCGVEMSTAKKGAASWMTKAGGGLDAVGVGGVLTGKGFDLIVIDDPIRNRAEAESAIIRNNIFEFCTSTAQSRLEPGGSIICTHTRWNPDDLIGRLFVEQPKEGWIYVNLPAVLNNGESLWPKRWPIGDLKKIEARSAYDWASLYMGQPRPKGGAVFNGAHTYDRLPEDVPCSAESMGVDLAYTAKTYSDFSVLVVGKKYGDKIFITNVKRAQTSTAVFAETIKNAKLSCPRAGIFWFIGGIERGIVNMLRSLGVHLRAEPAKNDKFVRAQPVAAAWNRGDILVPRNDEHHPWVSTFLNEVLAFTGVGDKHDDQVDALAAMYEPIRHGTGGGGMRSERILPF